MIEKNYVAELSEGVCSDAKAKIIKAAIEEFATYPLSAARTRSIAATAGVNHAAISYYFGGKNELYYETVRQLADYIHIYMADYFARGAEIGKTKSAADAKKLILDFVMSRVCIDSKSDALLRNTIMILTREEMYPTKAFDVIYEKIIFPSINLLSEMLAVCTGGKSFGERACILAHMLLGQIMLFNSARFGFKRVIAWKSFGDAEYKKVESVFSATLEKIIS